MQIIQTIKITFHLKERMFTEWNVLQFQYFITSLLCTNFNPKAKSTYLSSVFGFELASVSIQEQHFQE